MLTDTTIIHRHGAFEVVAQRHEVLWKDGSAVVLHPVRVVDAQGNSFEDTFLRAFQLQGLHWIVFDLRKCAPLLDADMRQHLPRDLPGIVFHTLRMRFPNAASFSLAAAANFKAAWFVDEVLAA